MLVLLTLPTDYIVIKIYCMNGLFKYIIHIQFIDIKGTSWGHGQVIGMCSRAIF